MSVERYWRDLLEGERLLRQEAERQLAAWRQAVQELALEFAPGLDIITPEDVSQLVVKLREMKAQAAEPWRSKYFALLQEMEILKSAQSTTKIEEPPFPPVWPETHPCPAAAVDVTKIKEMVRNWPIRAPFTKENAERPYTFLAILGYLGLSGRPRVSKIVAEIYGLSSGSTGSIQRVITKLVKYKLVQLKKEAGAPFALMLLTEKGKKFFKELAGQDPVPSEAELLLETHPNLIAHAAFCVWVKELAETFGYQVIIPRQTQQPWQPDLLFKDDSGVFGVEVERALGFEPESRQRKWINSHNAQGFAAVVAPDENVRIILREEIRKLGIKAKLTDISYILAQKERTLLRFWAEEI